MRRAGPAYCLNQLGEHSEAEEVCRVAIGIDGHRHNAYKNLGVALVGLGRYVNAAHAYLAAGILTLTTFLPWLVRTSASRSLEMISSGR